MEIGAAAEKTAREQLSAARRALAAAHVALRADPKWHDALLSELAEFVGCLEKCLGAQLPPEAPSFVKACAKILGKQRFNKNPTDAKKLGRRGGLAKTTAKLIASRQNGSFPKYTNRSPDWRRSEAEKVLEYLESEYSRGRTIPVERFVMGLREHDPNVVPVRSEREISKLFSEGSFRTIRSLLPIDWRPRSYYVRRRWHSPTVKQTRTAIERSIGGNVGVKLRISGSGCILWEKEFAAVQLVTFDEQMLLNQRNVAIHYSTDMGQWLSAFSEPELAEMVEAIRARTKVAKSAEIT